MSISQVQPSSDVQMSVEGLDLETALMLVQSERVGLLDKQLKTQMSEVDARNKKVAQLNDVLSDLNQVAAQYPGDADPAGVPKKWGPDKQNEYEIPLNDAIQSAGITDLGFSNGGKGQVTGQVIAGGPNVYNGSVPKGEIDAAISKVKGMIDGLTNTQQLDMLRLQSATSKRNEAFDLMSNVAKKLQENRSSIVSNMR